MWDPFQWLYRHGPRPIFWQGTPDADVCASETNVPSDHWARHPDMCQDLIERKVTAWKGFWFLTLSFVYVNCAVFAVGCLVCTRKYLFEPLLGKKPPAAPKD